MKNLISTRQQQSPQPESCVTKAIIAAAGPCGKGSGSPPALGDGACISQQNTCGSATPPSLLGLSSFQEVDCPPATGPRCCHTAKTEAFQADVGAHPGRGWHSRAGGLPWERAGGALGAKTSRPGTCSKASLLPVPTRWRCCADLPQGQAWQVLQSQPISHAGLPPHLCLSGSWTEPQD